MSKSGISEKVKQFIFEHIDSVELLDVLVFIRTHQNKSWSCEQLAHEMRSSPNSVGTRLESLKKTGLITHDPVDKSLCRYNRESDELEQIMEELTEIYKIKKQTILELIFSPLKKGRHFANAFVVIPSSNKKNPEDSDG